MATPLHCHATFARADDDAADADATNNSFCHDGANDESFHVDSELSSPLCPTSPPTPDAHWRRQAGVHPELRRLQRSERSRPLSDYGAPSPPSPATLPFSTGDGIVLVSRAPMALRRSRKRGSRLEMSSAATASASLPGCESDADPFALLDDRCSPPAKTADELRPVRSRSRCRLFSSDIMVPPLPLARVQHGAENQLGGSTGGDCDGGDAHALSSPPATVPSMRRYRSQISDYDLERSLTSRSSLSRSAVVDRRVVKMQRSSRVCSLPTIRGSHPDCNTISCDTLAELLTNPDSLPSAISSIRIIDCRYKYEYDGGAIRSAENIPSIDELESCFFPAPAAAGSTAIIFHCEFSSKRGPSQYRKLRGLDRYHKGISYPELFYPEIYLLEGGYHDFFKKYPGLCTPENYVPMKAEEHRVALRHARTAANRSNTLSRAHTAPRWEQPSRTTPTRSLRSQSHVELPMPRLDSLDNWQDQQ